MCDVGNSKATAEAIKRTCDTVWFLSVHKGFRIKRSGIV